MTDVHSAGMDSVQPREVSGEANLVKVSLNSEAAGVLGTPIPVASTAAVAISAGNQTTLQPEGSSDALLQNGGEVFLLIGLALIGMVAIVRRQKI